MKRVFRDGGTLLESCGYLAKALAMAPKDGSRRQRQVAVLIFLTLKQVAPAVRSYLGVAEALGATRDTDEEDTNNWENQHLIFRTVSVRFETRFPERPIFWADTA